MLLGAIAEPGLHGFRQIRQAALLGWCCVFRQWHTGAFDDGLRLFFRYSRERHLNQHDSGCGRQYAARYLFQNGQHARHLRTVQRGSCQRLGTVFCCCGCFCIGIGFCFDFFGGCFFRCIHHCVIGLRDRQILEPLVSCSDGQRHAGHRPVQHPLDALGAAFLQHSDAAEVVFYVHILVAKHASQPRQLAVDERGTSCEPFPVKFQLVGRRREVLRFDAQTHGDHTERRQRCGARVVADA